MTISEVSKQVFGLAVGGFINREKCTEQRLRSTIEHLLHEDSGQLIFEIALKDGWWFFSIDKLHKDFYDYYIPDTREQEQHLKRKLFKNTSPA